MNDEQLKIQLGANIASFRKGMGLTQAGLADKLNYSDKAVSKWERGESVPDVLTLVQLSELFGITVDALLTDPNGAPKDPVSAVTQPQKPKADRGVIVKLCSLLVWFVALLIFVILSAAGVPKGLIAFAYAIPVNAIVNLCLCSAWRDYGRNPLWISAIVWGCLLSLHASLLIFAGVNILNIYLLGIPGQIAIYLWFRMFRKNTSTREVANGQESPSSTNSDAQESHEPCAN